MEKPISWRKPLLKGALSADCPRWRPIDLSGAPGLRQDRSSTADPADADGKEAPESGVPSVASEVPPGHAPR
jgi:hypothetical protein